MAAKLRSRVMLPRAATGSAARTPQARGGQLSFGLYDDGGWNYRSSCSTSLRGVRSAGLGRAARSLARVAPPDFSRLASPGRGIHDAAPGRGAARPREFKFTRSFRG